MAVKHARGIDIEKIGGFRPGRNLVFVPEVRLLSEIELNRD